MSAAIGSVALCVFSKAGAVDKADKFKPAPVFLTDSNSRGIEDES
jgi:hypothetical protein|tara:strand:+ start:287 stop:421 length:135 start_codon:yes stop_codon:yes gene_type:complete